MKRFYSFLMAAAFAASSVALAAPKATIGGELELPKLAPKASTMTITKKSYKKAAGRAASDAPATITGNDYVSFYDDGESMFNSFFSIEKDSESSDANAVVLVGIANGYDVKGTYNATTGELTIPTGVSLGVFEQNGTNYGNIILYAIIDDETVSTAQDITATFSGDGSVSFDYGIYTAVEAGYLTLMENPSAQKSNAAFNGTYGKGTANEFSFSVPVLAYKTAADTVKILGMNHWNYYSGPNVYVPIQLNSSANTAGIQFGTVVDKRATTSGVGAKVADWTYGMIQNNGITHLIFKVEAASDKSTLTAAADSTFWCYNTSGTSYSGYFLFDSSISIDMDVFKAPVVNDPEPESTDVTVDDIYYTVNTITMTAQVTGCATTLTNANIASSIQWSGQTIPVTSVAASAFYNKSAITSVTLPSSLTDLGNGAFQNMSGLTTVNIESLEAYLNMTFGSTYSNPIYNLYNNNKNGTLNIAGQPTTEINVPLTVSSIPSYAFYSAKGITKVSMGAVSTIGTSAFAQCTNLTAVSFSENLETIGNSAFSSCSSLNGVKLPSGLQSLGTQVFYNCSSLEEITIPEGIKEIPQMCFYGCSGLKSVVLPSTLTKLVMYAFYGASSLTSVSCYATVPPTCASMPFSNGVYAAATLYVPEDNIEDYQAANIWKQFSKIESAPTSGIGAIVDNEAAVDGPVEYFNLQGVRISKPAAGQIVIMRQGSAVKKMVMK